jgi:hypothetical protein
MWFARGVVSGYVSHPAQVRIRGEHGQIGAHLRGDIARRSPRKMCENRRFSYLFRKNRPWWGEIEEVGREARGEPSFQDP